MKHPALWDVLSAVHPLSKRFETALARELVPVSFPKNHTLLEIPGVAEFVYFIETGFAMSYSFDNKARTIECFWQSRQIMTAVGSFSAQVPTTVGIQLMSDSNLLCLSREALFHLMNKHKEAHFLYHKMILLLYTKLRMRIHDIQNLSAADRFSQLLRGYPEVEQIISQENIASYLGITPQSLSRLKRVK
jgi:CRP-like cAMP-binding protein